MTHKKPNQKNNNPAQQRGFVLVIVMVLILLVTGLGLLAMRHARQELSSSAAYIDSTTTIALAESAMAMVVDDLKKSSDYYRLQFANANNIVTATAGGGLWNVRYNIPLNPARVTDEAGVASSYCDAAAGGRPGCIRLLTSPRFDNGGASVDLYPGTAFYTSVLYDVPVVGPCPPGFSCFDDQNYGWYVFGVHVIAESGPEGVGSTVLSNFWQDDDGTNGNRFISTSRAEGAARLTIGPIKAYGQ